MKRFVLSLLVATGFALGGASAASAQDYPPDATVVPSTATPAPGAPFSVTVTGCTNGETVTFVFDGTTRTAVCTGGTATASFTAPTTPGTASGTATFGDDAMSFSVVVTAPAVTTVPTPTSPVGGLPGTGSDSNSTMMVALLLLVAGLGMFAVSQVRRRQPTAA